MATRPWWSTYFLIPPKNPGLCNNDHIAMLCGASVTNEQPKTRNVTDGVLALSEQALKPGLALA